jgi:aminopeptidase N
LNPFRSCFDVIYYNLSLHVDPGKRSIAGYNQILLEPVEDFQKIQIDLFSNLVIDSVLYEGELLTFEREGNACYLRFPATVKTGLNITIYIYYHGEPVVATHPPWDGGFIWDKDSLNRDWIGVSCQGIGASLWWPNKDHLSDEPDSMRFTLEIPGHLTGVSNGRLSDTVLLDNGNKKWTWEVSYPINNYNVSINIGHYTHFKEIYQGNERLFDLNYYVLDYNLEKAKKQFQQVPPMLKCYEHYFGPYPFPNDGFKLVEAPYFGMEHQSGIAYGNNYENNEFDLDYIIIHESGHEYWGNSVSINDLAQLWVHESFATYMESMFIEYFHGKEMAIEYLMLQRELINNQNPMIGPLEVNYDNWMDADIYYKGAWMLHSVRNTINDDDVWFKLLKDTYRKFQYKTVSSEDIINFIDDHTEYSFKPIFNNFLHIEKVPVLWIKEKNKKENIILIYKWRDVNDDFNMPVEIRYGQEILRLYPTVEKQRLFLEKVPDEVIHYATDLFYFEILGKSFL